RHLAVVGGAGCGDGQYHGPIFIVTVATGAAAVVPNADALTNERSVGWLDNQTLWWVGGGVFEYRLGAPSARQLPGIETAAEAEVRGTLLFVVEQTFDTYRGNAQAVVRVSLLQYSLVQQREVRSVDFGSFELPINASPGDYHYQGWDVSTDGSQLVYQASGYTPGHTGITSSHIEYVSLAGSGDLPAAKDILQYMTTDQVVRLRLSPDGRWVAVTE